jgi:hypothetical protein
MKNVKLNSYSKSNLPNHYYSLKVVDTDNQAVLANTEKYPCDLTLPATFLISSHPKLNLYQRDHISIQLWGDSTGLLAASTIKMAEYKIQFPIDMEMTEGAVSFGVMGTWE